MDVSKDVLIIDEGHNIAQVIEDSNSFKLSTDVLIRALGELKEIKRKVKHPKDIHEKFAIIGIVKKLVDKE